MLLKVTIPGAPVRADIGQFTRDGSNTIEGVDLAVNDPDVRKPDCWIVIDNADERDPVASVARSQLIYASAEVVRPPGFLSENDEVRDFLAPFGRIVTFLDLVDDRVTYDLPFLPWMINANHGDAILAGHRRDRRYLEHVDRLEKPRTISMFCSAQDATPEHRLRLRFATALKAHFGDALDWYGNGVNSLPEKWDGIAPYRYHIALENQSRHHVITEKLYDAFLGLSLPIYWGAPDVATAVPAGSFETIDLHDFAGSVATIERILDADPYEERLPAVRKARDCVLGELNLFERLARIGREHTGAQTDDRAREVALVPWGHAHLTRRQYVARRGERFARAALGRLPTREQRR